MHSNHRVANRSHRAPAATDHTRGDVAIEAGHQLLSDSWTAQVDALESAIDGFRIHADLANHCVVTCFEIAGDAELHVNVTHRYATQAVTGWAGPGKMADGFVYNRRFSDRSQKDMVRHVRDVVFAARV